MAPKKYVSTKSIHSDTHDCILITTHIRMILFLFGLPFYVDGRNRICPSSPTPSPSCALLDVSFFHSLAALNVSYLLPLSYPACLSFFHSLAALNASYLLPLFCIHFLLPSLLSFPLSLRLSFTPFSRSLFCIPPPPPLHSFSPITTRPRFSSSLSRYNLSLPSSLVPPPPLLCLSVSVCLCLSVCLSLLLRPFSLSSFPSPSIFRLPSSFPPPLAPPDPHPPSPQTSLFSPSHPLPFSPSL